ncbi:DUF6883 domain-containing protein [Microbacterium aurantiacum]|uniref:DUF6883 domain-containing protein n=1 Tax=Microbacterium aurantiacum TaxID=162393 RepID=UPI003D718DFA
MAQRAGAIKRESASFVYLFRVHEGNYGDRVYQALLAELIEREPSASSGFRFHWGDYLPFHSLWNVRVKVEGGAPSAVREFDAASPDALNQLYIDLLASASQITADPAIADEMPNGCIWAVAISNQYTPIHVLDHALRTRVSDVYLGALQLDPANPLHVALTFDVLPMYGFYSAGHLALRLDGDLWGEVHDSPPSGEYPDLPWYAGLGSKTHSTAGVFNESPSHDRFVMISHGQEVVFPLPPGPRQVSPSKRGLASLTLLLRGLTTYGVDQLLTGLLQLSGSVLKESIDRWPRLPDFTTAVIDEKKLRDYALNPNHPEGKHKATVFSATLGFGREHAALFVQRLRDAILDDPIIQGLTGSKHGVSWHLDLTIEGLNGHVDVVRTAWIVNYHVPHPVPRLTSLRVLRNQS